MTLPLIAHMDCGDPECCGCLYMVVLDSGNEYRCNECDVLIEPEVVQRAIMEMPSVLETCPHCSKVNEIDGFTKVAACSCRHCGSDVIAGD